MGNQKYKKQKQKTTLMVFKQYFIVFNLFFSVHKNNYAAGLFFLIEYVGHILYFNLAFLAYKITKSLNSWFVSRCYHT